MATKSFFNKFMAVALFVLAAVINFSCTDDDVANTERSSRSVAKKVETSNLTVDNYYGTGTLSVKVVNTDPQGVSTEQNGDATAKCTVSPETDPVETSNMSKTFTVGKINKSADGKTVTCDITVNGAGQENVLKCRVVIDPVMVFGTTYTIDVKNIRVDEDNVRIVDTSKKQGETGRQAVQVPVIFTLASNGTELDNQEDHQKDVTLNAVWEQYQKETTKKIIDEIIESWTWTINGGLVNVNHHVKEIWSNDSISYSDYPCVANYSGRTIEHEDKTVKNWKVSLKQILGLTTGTPAEVACSYPYYKVREREDFYEALHETEGETKCVYFWSHPEITFEKGNMKHVCDFISPSFSENSDDLLDAQSMKSGYDLKQFRNSVTVKYGNANTGIDERVLEERQNLYKAAKAVKGIELISATTEYPSFAIDFTAKYRLVYNDDTKSDVQTTTTSRPWTLTYDGSWSMTATGDVNQSTTAIVLTKGESKTEEQSIANGKWVCTSTGFTADNNTTVDNQVQKNGWKMNIPTKMSLFMYDTEIPFEIAAPKAEAKDIKITLTNSTATQEDYKFSENLNVTVGTDTEVSEGYGFVTKAVEVTVVSWEWNAKQWVEGKNVKAFVERIYHMSDGSTKTVRRDFTGTIGSNVYTYFETTETSNQESTGAAQFILVNTEHKTEGDWGYDYSNSKLNFGVTYAGSEQTDGWNLYLYNNLSCTIDGETYTFPALDMSATANSTQTKKSEDDSKTTYEHSNAATFYFGGSAIALDAAKGLVFVNKTVIPEGHDGFFPKEYGRIEGYNRVACRNPKNQKDWGVGISVKFTNGSICGFITKDGSLEWGSFESGSTTWDGASPDGNGTLMNVTAKDASTAMKWRRGDSTINMMSYSDGTLMGFNWGHNTVYTDHFGGNIEQKDGGKYQILTINGVQGSWDSSY